MGLVDKHNCKFYTCGTCEIFLWIRDAERCPQDRLQTVAELDARHTAQDLFWDQSFAISRRLRAEHPAAELDAVGLSQIFDWVIALPDFADDPELCNEGLLAAIYQDWYEELDAA